MIGHHLWIYASGNAVSIRFDEETSKKLEKFAVREGYNALKFEDEIMTVEGITSVESSHYQYESQGIFGKIFGPYCRSITIKTKMSPEEKANVGCCSSSREEYWHQKVTKVIEIIQKYIPENAKETGIIDDYR